MPARRKINLEQLHASLGVSCPKCGTRIEPKDYKRVDWEHIKFQETDKDLQEKQMAALADRAAALVQQYQTRPEAMIWHGIIISEQASMASGSTICATPMRQ